MATNRTINRVKADRHIGEAVREMAYERSPEAVAARAREAALSAARRIRDYAIDDADHRCGVAVESGADEDAAYAAFEVERKAAWVALRAAEAAIV